MHSAYYSARGRLLQRILKSWRTVFVSTFCLFVQLGTTKIKDAQIRSARSHEIFIERGARTIILKPIYGRQNIALLKGLNLILEMVSQGLHYPSRVPPAIWPAVRIDRQNDHALVSCDLGSCVDVH
jgi:hypothetical protein